MRYLEDDYYCPTCRKYFAELSPDQGDFRIKCPNCGSEWAQQEDPANGRQVTHRRKGKGECGMTQANARDAVVGIDGIKAASGVGRYSVEYTEDGKIVVKGLIPVRDFLALEKAWDDVGYNVMDFELAVELGATMVVRRRAR